jgi:hypothetical protein
MPTTFSTSEFDKHPKRAGKSAANGPVFISKDGIHAYALIAIQDYRRLGGPGETILDVLAMPEYADFDFEFPRMGDELVQPADLSD